MGELAAMFEGLGFDNVRTFIASGNVLFEAGDRGPLETRIEAAIAERFGHQVAVMVRTCAEITELAERLPALSPPDRAYVLFLASTPNDEGVSGLKAFETEVDRFEFLPAEVIWTCNRTKGPSLLANVAIEKKLGVAATARDANTVRRLASLCHP